MPPKIKIYLFTPATDQSLERVSYVIPLPSFARPIAAPAPKLRWEMEQKGGVISILASHIDITQHIISDAPDKIGYPVQVSIPIIHAACILHRSRC